jgi:hypothetical protein
MISFGSRLVRANTWSWFKPLIISKSFKVQFEEDSSHYMIYGYDGPEVLTCTIYKGDVPASIIAGGYDQSMNDADKAEFEADYKGNANRSIDDVPSKIIAKPLKDAGTSADMAVDGSVTPVVYFYNPPANWDIEIHQLSFLFEDADNIAFGNQFVLDTVDNLANGLLLEVKATDESFTWQNMKRTRDLIEICEDFDVVTGARNFFRVKVHLPRSLRLARDGTFGSPDYIQVTVRDDLSSFNFIEAFFQGVKI